MNAPTYRKFIHHGARRVHLLWWRWEVTDGVGGPLLVSGHRLTQSGAENAAAKHAAECERWEDVQIRAIVARLHENGIDVETRFDERHRLHVHPSCPCTDQQHRQCVLAFASVGPVLWEVAR